MLVPRFLCLFLTAVLLAGCNSNLGHGGSTEPIGPEASVAAQWELSNSTILSVIQSDATGGAPSNCLRADFRIPGGTDFVLAKLTPPPNVNPAQPGVGQLGVLLRAPNETRIDGHHQVGLLDPPPGRWTVGIYGDPVAVNQSATVTVTLRGTGNATAQELVFWKEPAPFPWQGYDCPSE